MIAADTSTWIAYLQGDAGADTRLLDRAVAGRQVVMPPAVLTELLSDPELRADVASSFLDLPLLEVTAGYWRRSGALRASVLALGRKARLGDALIAQSCVDHGVALITRDKAFIAFTKAANLDLAP